MRDGTTNPLWPVNTMLHAAMALGITLLFSIGAAEAAEKYTIKDIGAIGAEVSVEGMNNSGQIVGTAPTGIARTTFRAWLYNGERVIDFNTCGGLGCRAMGINTNGQIVGNIGRDPYIYSHGKFVDIAAFARPRGIALAINDLAEVVGWYTLIPVPGENFPSERHAFLYRGRRLTDLGTLGGTESVATSINNAAQVVGYSSNYGGETHAFLYGNERMLDLGTLGGTESRATAINELGHVVGSANISGSNKPHAFLYRDGKMTDLGTLDSPESHALSINQSGQIVGMSGPRAFLYSRDKMVDLQSLLPPDSGWNSVIPRCINDSGQIAGTGMLDGKVHVLLLSPAP